MKHAGCHSLDTQVVDSRPSNGRIRRRRSCKKCWKAFTTYEITREDFELFMQAEERQHELESPIWAVISHDHVKATNLTYAEAADMVRKLGGLNDTGICLVTADVAARISKVSKSETDPK